MIPALIPALLPVLGELLDRLIPDKAEAERAKRDLEAKLALAAAEASAQQVELNKAEAAHGSVFVAGWRPFIGWVGGVGLAWLFVGEPIARWAVALWAPGTPVPELGGDHLFELVLAMLGLGGLRTWEKARGLTVNMPGSVQPLPMPPRPPR